MLNMKCEKLRRFKQSLRLIENQQKITKKRACLKISKPNRWESSSHIFTLPTLLSRASNSDEMLARVTAITAKSAIQQFPITVHYWK
ncbi:hypothetical protein [Nostoc sp.]|uniref:hypothetical protein n=1 Tax=Nostoc sp. TaxID=1180 RepID=UPI002FF9B1FD